MKRSIETILQERFGDPIGSYAGDAPVGVRSIDEDVCPTCGMKDCECDHTMSEEETCTATLGPCVGSNRISEAEICNQCGMMPLEGDGCGCTHLEEAKKNRGLWANIHARRKAGKRPKRRGEKGYPKTLDVDK